jgi:hypothetical protein
MSDPSQIPAAATTALQAGQLLQTLLLGGSLGLLGQGVRSVAGLKSMTDDAKALEVSPSDIFRAARLITSLLIGFLVGVAAALALYSSGTAPDLSFHELIMIVATGYAGADFLEGFISQYIAPTGGAINAAIAVKANQLAAKAVPPGPGPKPAVNARSIVYGVFGIPATANPTTTDAIQLSDTPYDNYRQALTDKINDQIDQAGLPPTKHVKPQPIISATAIGDIVKAVATAIA